MNNRVKVGVVGLGEVAQVIHLPILELLSDRFEVAAVCDVSPRLVDVVAEQYRVEGRYHDADDLVAHDGLDAVLVATSDEYHTDCVTAAAKAGKHVLVEKPMCLTRREAEAVIQARDAGGVQVMVGYMRRYAPAFVDAVAEVATWDTINYARFRDIIGRNRLLIDQTSVVRAFDDIDERQSADRARRSRELVAEAVGDVAEPLRNAYRLLCGLNSHDLSAMREIIGLPRGVVAAAQWNNGRFLSVLFDYGDYCAVLETGVDQQKRFDCSIEVHGDLKSVRVDYDTPYIRQLPTTLTLQETVGEAYQERVVRPTFKDPYVHELEQFYAVATGTAQPKTTPEDYLEDLTVFGMIMDALKARG